MRNALVLSVQSNRSNIQGQGFSPTSEMEAELGLGIPTSSKSSEEIDPGSTSPGAGSA